MAGGPEKVDHRGNFIQLPKMLLDSLAWRHASSRERSVLLTIQARHNGFNNGQIGITIHEIGAANGNQSHGLNSKAVAACIGKGFLECTADANHHQSKSRTYRLTYISTRIGAGSKTQPATNEYLEWRPPERKTRKFGAAINATQSGLAVEETATRRKVVIEESATPSTVSCGFEPTCCGEETASLIGNQSQGLPGLSLSAASLASGTSKPRAANIGVELAELRDWTKDVLTQLGYGGQRQLAASAGVPEPIMSRFRGGSNLPERYRLRLQEACARSLPYLKWKNSRAAWA